MTYLPDESRDEDAYFEDASGYHSAQGTAVYSLTWGRDGWDDSPLEPTATLESLTIGRLTLTRDQVVEIAGEVAVQQAEADQSEREGECL